MDTELRRWKGKTLRDREWQEWRYHLKVTGVVLLVLGGAAVVFYAAWLLAEMR